ncbi:MAG: hypothetical protein LBS35_14665 [Synergistaceae bacterium]|nr:hypothetical protein [Synergistaceae bacterium]
MKKTMCIVIAVLSVFLTATAVCAWKADGAIPGTDISYSGLTVSRNGVAVKLTNNSGYDVKVSLKLTFLSADGNVDGYALFGMRTIAAGSEAAVSRNYLTGKWKTCQKSARIIFEKMTYELIYY